MVVVRRKEKESAGEARNGRGEISDSGEYSSSETRKADFGIDKQLSTRGKEERDKERKREREKERERERMAFLFWPTRITRITIG